MKPASLRRWVWVHSWSSLICTVFLLMLCLTGLPLVFHDDIDRLLNTESWEPDNPDSAPLTLDQLLTVALANQPGDVPIYMSFDVDRPVVNVTTGESAGVPDTKMHFASFDATSGDLVPPADAGAAFMELMLRLHTDLFLGLPGMYFLGAMGALFLLATVSGMVLYVPFMHRLAFGVVRRERSRRLKWLDYHNLLGAITLAWVLVVGLTGVINTLEAPIIDGWRDRELASLIADNDDVRLGTERASLEAAVDGAVRLAPEMQLQFVAFPGSAYSTDAHYAVFLHGSTPLTEHLITPVMVRADTGQIDGRREMPLIAKALSLSRPLHFGDYGGLGLKIVWAVLDILTIVILLSGLYLWWRKRNPAPEAKAGAPAPAGAAL